MVTRCGALPEAIGMSRGHTLAVPSTEEVGVSDRGGELS